MTDIQDFLLLLLGEVQAREAVEGRGEEGASGGVVVMHGEAEDEDDDDDDEEDDDDEDDDDDAGSEMEDPADIIEEDSYRTYEEDMYPLDNGKIAA